MKNSKHSTDAFLQIAQQSQTRGHDLVEPQPVPPKHRTTYSLNPSSNRVCQPPESRDEPWFNDELKRMQLTWEPFLETHAPPLSLSRQQVELKSFDWRIDSGMRPERLPDALNGHGEWQRITIPHYGGPMGQATTFYRTILTLPEPAEGQRLWLHFEGVDYLATVYVNGTMVGQHEGFFAPFEFDVTEVIIPEQENILLVQVDNDAIMMGNDSWDSPEAGDKLYAATGPGWDDPELGWHHCPPGMGICRSAYFEFRPETFISNGWVRPLPEESAIELWLELTSHKKGKEDLKAAISIFGRNLKETILPETTVELSGKPGTGRNDYRIRLQVSGLKNWTPDYPWLYTLQVCVGADAREWTFGWRSFSIETEEKPKGRLFLNGKPVRLRGVNTMGHEQQCVMAGDLDQLRDDLLIYKMAGINYIRFTQRPVEREVYALCDALGLMAQADLPLFKNLRRNQFNEAVRQCTEMERFVRNHPSVVMTSFINEPFPLSWHNALHRHLGKEEMLKFFEAASIAVLQENPDRVIKPVDGDYDPPSPGLPDNHCYALWYNGHGIPFGKLEAGYWQAVKPGWHYACGEYGAEGLDPVDLMQRRYPAKWLPQSKEEEQDWTPGRIRKAQTGNMYQVFYDRPKTLEDWVEDSQSFQAWAVQVMTETFRRDPRMVSFALHLGIDAFPSGWMKTVVDCERRPKKAFFAFRDALQPVLPTLRAPRRFWWADEAFEAELWISNDRPERQTGLSLRAELLCNHTVTASLVSPLPELPGCEPVGAGKLNLPLPATRDRISCVLRLQVLDSDETLLGSSEFGFDVFARDQNLPHELPSPECTGEMIEKARMGETVVCGPLPIGDYEFPDLTFAIQPIGMGELLFCSRATGHPLVEGFEQNDFRLWYNEDKGYADDFADSVIVGEGWTPILLAGRGGFGEPWTPSPVAAECPVGKGRLIVCQLNLAGRIRKNPPASFFAGRLMALANQGKRA